MSALLFSFITFSLPTKPHCFIHVRTTSGIISTTCYICVLCGLTLKTNPHLNFSLPFPYSSVLLLTLIENHSSISSLNIPSLSYPALYFPFVKEKRDADREMEGSRDGGERRRSKGISCELSFLREKFTSGILHLLYDGNILDISKYKFSRCKVPFRDSLNIFLLFIENTKD